MKTVIAALGVVAVVAGVLVEEPKFTSSTINTGLYAPRKASKPFLTATGTVTVLSAQSGLVVFRDNVTGKVLGNDAGFFNDNYQAKK